MYIQFLGLINYQSFLLLRQMVLIAFEYVIVHFFRSSVLNKTKMQLCRDYNHSRCLNRFSADNEDWLVNNFRAGKLKRWHRDNNIIKLNVYAIYQTISFNIISKIYTYIYLSIFRQWFYCYEQIRVKYLHDLTYCSKKNKGKTAFPVVITGLGIKRYLKT